MNRVHSNKIKLNKVTLNGAKLQGSGGKPYPPSPDEWLVLGVGKLNVNKIA